MTNNPSDPSPPPVPSSPPPAPSEAASPQPPAPAADPWTERLKQNMVAAIANGCGGNVTVTAVLLGLAVAAGRGGWLPARPCRRCSPSPSTTFACPAKRLWSDCSSNRRPPGAVSQEPRRRQRHFCRSGPPQCAAGEAGHRPTRASADGSSIRRARAAGPFHRPVESNRQDRIEQGRIFFLPRETELVLVDLQDLFADDGPGTDGRRPEQDRVARADRRAAEVAGGTEETNRLPGSPERHGGRLPVGAAWIASRSRSLPPGPVLGRPSYHDSKTADDARQQSGSGLAEHWKVTPFKKG